MFMTTEAQAVAEFKAYLQVSPITAMDGFGNRVECRSLALASELDYDALNQCWADWIDSMISEGRTDEDAYEWDWEGYERG